MKVAVFFLLLPLLSSAQTPDAYNSGKVPPVTVTPGVILKELMGRTAPAHSENCSVALFHLEPGRASEWSHNKVGEESFYILKGHGQVWTGNQAHAVGPGSFILVPPSVVRSIRAGKSDELDFYAVTTPAWSRDDDMKVDAPVGAPK